MHPGHMVLNPKCDGAWQGRYMAADHCRRTRHGANVSQSLPVPHVVLVRVLSHAAHVWLSVLRHSSYLSVRTIALLADVRARPLSLYESLFV